VAEKYDLEGIAGAETFRMLPEGLKLKLKNGAIGEITGNPHDGGFVLLTYIEYPGNPEKVGEEEAVFFLDVTNVLD
jgi:hypothetical protein